jgi:hypothetical protein
MHQPCVEAEGALPKLPSNDARKRLTALAGTLRQAGLESISAEHYEGGRWSARDIVTSRDE